MSEQKPHSELEPAALVELAVAVGQWLGAESAPVDVIHAQERVVEWAKRLEEQLEALDETLRLITEAAGDDGTAPDDWRANTDKPRTALFAVRELRRDYDEAIGVKSSMSLGDSYPASVPK